MAASVRLKVDDPDGHSYGSGTIIDAQGGEALAMTCAHVFRDSRGKGPSEPKQEARRGAARPVRPRTAAGARA